jgi:hypothetical protein
VEVDPTKTLEEAVGSKPYIYVEAGARRCRVPAAAAAAAAVAAARDVQCVRRRIVHLVDDPRRRGYFTFPR